MSLNPNVKTARGPATLSGELERLAAMVNTARNNANIAETIASNLSGPFPVPDNGVEGQEPGGYMSQFRALLDELDAAHSRTAYAHNRISESMTDEVPAQAGYAVEALRKF